MAFTISNLLITSLIQLHLSKTTCYVTMTNPNGTEVVIDNDGELKSGKLVTEDGYTEVSGDGHIKGEYTDKSTGIKLRSNQPKTAAS